MDIRRLIRRPAWLHIAGGAGLSAVLVVPLLAAPSSTSEAPEPARAEATSPSARPAPKPSADREKTARRQDWPTTQQWTPNSHTVAKRGGQVTTTVFSQPRFKRTAEGWTRLSGRLTRLPAGRGTLASEVVVPTLFGETGDQLMELRLGSGPIELLANGADLSRPRVSSRVSSGRLDYDEVFKDVDVRYDVDGASIKESLILQKATSRRDFSFTLLDPEHRLGQVTRQDNDSVLFSRPIVTGTGQTVFLSLDAPAAWRASDARRTEPLQSRQEVTTTPRGYRVELALVEQGLTAADFPVVLDPTLAYQTTNQTLASAYAPIGATACSGGPCPLVSNPYSYVQVTNDDFYGRGEVRGYYRTSLANIPSSTVIDSADFTLGFNYANRHPSLDLHSVSTALSSSATGVDLAANEDAPVLGVYPECTPGACPSVGINYYQSADVTSRIRQLVSAGGAAEAGFSLRQTPGSGDGGNCSFGGCPCKASPCVDSAQLTVAYQGSVLPPPIPVQQTWGCDCRWAHGADSSGRAADPVNTADGNAQETFVDLTTVAPGVPVTFRRTYNGLDGADGPLGVGWTHEYNASLIEDAVTQDVTFRDPTGGQSTFRRQPGGAYLSDPGVTGDLVAVAGGGWKLTATSGEVLTFDSAGRETSDVDAGGRGVSLTYTSGQLTSLTDAAGHVTTISYGSSGAASGKISSISTADGRSVQYAYTTVSGSSRLTSVTDPKSQTSQLIYSSTNGRLTGITTPGSSQNARNIYDATTGRITSQQDANNAVTTFSWTASSDPNAPAGTGVETITDPLNQSTTDNYYGNVLIAHTDALGNTTNYYYDSDLNLTGVQDPLGRITTMTYDSRGNQLSKTAAPPISTTESWTYDTANNVTSYTNGRGKTTAYTYNTANQVLTSTDPLSQVTQYTYTANGRLASIQTAAGRTTTFTYDASGNRTSSTSPSGRVTTYAYDSAGRLASQTTPRGNVTGATPEDFTTHYTYDTNGRPLTVIDPSDTVTSNIYDSNGNLINVNVTDPSTSPASTLSDVSSTFDANDRLLTTTEFAGTASARTTATYTYDATGRVLSHTDATGAKITYGYDGSGQLVSTTSPRGNAAGASPSGFTTYYTYDANGNRIYTVDPAGQLITTEYDVLDRPVSNTTPLGSKTTTVYDANDNIVATTDALGNRKTLTYDAADRLIGSSLPGQPASSFTYDADGNRLTATSPSGASKATWTYNSDGELQTQVDPNGNVSGGSPSTYTTTSGYDADGNLTSSTDQLGRVTTYTYDSRGNQTSATTPRSQTTTWTYDRLNRLTLVVPPGTNGGDTSYTYDQYGDLVTMTDDVGRTKTYQYNARHQTTKVTDQLNRPRTYTYDPDGNLTSWTSARGYASGATASDWTVTQTYDGRGLLTARTTSNIGVNAGTNATMAYDADGQLTQLVDGTGTSTFAYDTAGQLTGVTQPQGSYTYTYTPAGQVSSRTYPASGAIDSTYNTDGLQTSLIADGKTTTFGYDANQQLASITYPASVGLVQTRTYDPVGQVSVLQNKKTTASTPLSKFEYTRDLSDNPTRVKTTRGTTVTNDAFSYNQKDGLLKYCPGSTSCANAANYIGYTYTASGNGHRNVETRVGVTNPGTTTYTYDAADQLTKKVVAPTSGTATTTNYSNTADGQPASDGRTWNVLGQLATSNYTGPGSATYTYDGLGNRRTVTTSAGTRKLSWDINNPIPMLGVVTDPSGSTFSQRYDPMGETLQTQHPSGVYASSYYAHSDLGTITDVLQGTGSPAWNYTYEPFGASTTATALVTGAINTNFGFVGEYREPALSGQYALRARDYDPATGRFATTDPVASPVTDAYISPYVYANNRPTILTDPTGNCPWGVVGAVVGAVAGGVVNGAVYAATTDDFTWGGLGTAVAVGAITGAVAGGTLGLGTGLFGTGLAGTIAAEAFSSAATTVAGTFLTEGRLPTQGEWATGFVSAVVGTGSGYAAARLANCFAKSVGSSISSGAATIAANRVAPRFIGNSAGDLLDTTRVTIPEGKFEYLLKNPSKSGVFKDSLGFDQEGLNQALRNHLTTNFGNASSSVPMTGGGTKFAVRGPITGPSGKTWNITSAWGVDPDGSIRLITATP